MSRREFPRGVKVEIYRRAKDPAGVLRCEKCCAAVAAGEIHHIDMDAMQTDKTGRLVADDGIFLCRPCHKAITATQAPKLAKVKRIEAKHLGIRGRGFRPREKAPKVLSKAIPPRPIYEEEKR